MAEPSNSDENGRVLPEYREVFDEIFRDDDSDEFEGFEPDDVDPETAPLDVFAEERWTEGGRPPNTFTFTGRSGVNINTEDHDYLDYFESIFTRVIFEGITEETNRYAAQYLEMHPNLPDHSRLKKWTPTTDGEIKAFLGMTIAMGLVRQLNIQDYWSTDPVVSTPFFSSVMSRDRFLSIMSYLHLSDNTSAIPRSEEGYSPLQKLGKPYQDILANFESVYTPEKNLAVDEGMIPWRGNLNFRVYSPDKPVKYGLKVYMLCDSSNGYCSRLELYTGREGPRQQPSEYGVTYDLVMRLICPYLDKGYHLYVDNYFSSPHLFYNLFLNSTLACGTLRSNRRGVPQNSSRHILLKERSPSSTTVLLLPSNMQTRKMFVFLLPYMKVHMIHH